MKTITLIAALIISGILFVASFPKEENDGLNEKNDLISAIWEDMSPHYSNDYFTMGHKYKPGAFYELSKMVCSDVKITLNAQDGKSSINYTGENIKYSIDRYYLRYAEK